MYPELPGDPFKSKIIKYLRQKRRSLSKAPTRPPPFFTQPGNAIGETFRHIRLQVVTLLCSASVVFIIGLLDDLRGLPARFKFLAEILAAGSLCLVGVRISSIAVTDAWTLHFGLLGWPLTVLWIVGITNAVNLSDGLDGLAAGISAVACGVIAVFAIYSGNLIMAVLMLALLGSLSGFLFFNFHPAKIFMGDCLSLIHI